MGEFSIRSQESRSSKMGSGERSPLLGGESGSGSVRSDTLAEERGEVESIDEGDGDKANQEVGRGRALLIVFSLWGLIFLQASNISGMTTAQSKIAEDLDAFAAASWFTSTYLIAMSSTSPLVAQLATIFSPRSCVLFASILFSLGGFLASQATTLASFLIGRAVQGLGGAGVVTVSFILVLELSGKKRRGLFIGLVNTGFTTGVSFGAVVAGALVKGMGWRFLFWIQTPLALLFGLGIFLSIPKGFHSGTSGGGGEEVSIFKKLMKIDYLGAISLTTSLSLFLFGLSGPKILPLPIILSLLLLILFILTELYFITNPIIPISILKSRGALLSCTAQLGIMAARWGILFYSPAYALAVLGWGPASAGAILIPTNLGFAMGGILAGVFHIKRSGSFWLPSIISYILFSLTILLTSLQTTSSYPTSLFILTIFLNGLCIGSALNYTLAHLLHLTPPSTHFISTSLLTTFRGFAGSFGSAIGGGLFVRVLKSELENGFEKNGGLDGEREELVRRLLGSPGLVGRLEGVEGMVAKRGYEVGLRSLFMAGAVLALMMVAVQAGTGWKLAGVGDVKDGGRGEEESILVGEEDWEEGLESGA